jgi:hypothetical protein
MNPQAEHMKAFVGESTALADESEDTDKDLCAADSSTAAHTTHPTAPSRKPSSTTRPMEKRLAFTFAKTDGDVRASQIIPLDEKDLVDF